jgi:hypothetical protein
MNSGKNSPCSIIYNGKNQKKNEHPSIVEVKIADYQLFFSNWSCIKDDGVAKKSDFINSSLFFFLYFWQHWG